MSGSMTSSHKGTSNNSRFRRFLASAYAGWVLLSIPFGWKPCPLNARRLAELLSLFIEALGWHADYMVVGSFTALTGGGTTLVI